jgi:adenylosuccinate synthase
MTGRIHGKKSATVIIGAGFGDEGKGLLTDWAAAPFGADGLVVRFNGGAQAGHTVVLPDGTRHVHSHLGSGALAGAATFLSRFFVSNPLLFEREIAELEKKGASSPVVLADPSGLVTTPYDMLINQFAEQARGSKKHGSCGVGFGETIERGLRPDLSTTVASLADRKALSQKLDKICREWAPRRLAALGITALSDEQRAILNAAELKNNFLESAAAFVERVRPASRGILQTAAHLVFEGAQGLLLDQDIGWFPHVTRSNTGLKNVIELAAESGIRELEAIYATRCYATRHGAGPLPHELPAPPFKGIRDETNIHNPYQGDLRFGWLDLDLLARTIDLDLANLRPAAATGIKRRLAITCLDQLDAARVAFVSRGQLCRAGIDDFILRASRAVNVRKTYLSSGPTRETMSAFRLAKCGSLQTKVG